MRTVIGRPGRLPALEDHPRPVEISGGEILAANREVQLADIAPHPAGVVVRVDLEEHDPVFGAAFERGRARIAISLWVPDVQAMRGELALELPGRLLEVRPAADAVLRPSRCRRVELFGQRDVAVV